MSLLDYVRLMRPTQWFKNLIIFAPLFVYGKLFDPSVLLLTMFGFIIFCVLSSAVYVINDIIDVEADRAHSEKKFRPLASRAISITSGKIFAIALIGATAFLTRIILHWVEILFVGLVAALFFLTLLYSVRFKHSPVLDLFFIAFNFAIRCAAGFLTIHKNGAPWFLLTIFFLALFWALGKRKVELDVLGEKASFHKKIYNFYKKDMIYGFVSIVLCMLLFSYGLLTYFDLGAGWITTLTVPIASFMGLRYLYFIYSGNKIAAAPQRFFKDKQLALALTLWVAIIFFFTYLPQGLNPFYWGLHVWQTFL